MKTEQEVQDRIRYLLGIELDRRIREHSTPLPHKCCHNIRHHIKDNKLATKGKLPTIGLCGKGIEDSVQWGGTVCEHPEDICKDYSPTLTVQDIQYEFEHNLKDMSWVMEHLPEVYGLLWVLGENRKPLSWWDHLCIRLYGWWIGHRLPQLPPLGV